MNWLESMFISFAISVIRGLVKNPSHAAAVREQMLTVADDIYVAYGIVPPEHAFGPGSVSAPANNPST